MAMDAVHFSALGHHVKLGALAPREDARTPLFAKYKTEALPAPPGLIAWGKKVPTFPMYDNDKLGDCTCAAVGHQEQVWTSMNGGIWTPRVDEVTNMYWATGSEDTGRYETDILDYWHKVGFGDQRRKIAGYMRVNPFDANEVKQAIWLFGGLYIGVALPIAAQNQHLWHVTTGSDAQPGSWGGHAVNVTAYNNQYVTCVTWGMRMRMTWGWFRMYCQEAYAVLSADWATGEKASPSGFNFASLQDDLAAL